MAEIRFLAFDLGAESGRAVLGTLCDGRLALVELHRFANPHEIKQGRMRWNLAGQWEQIKTGLRRAAGCGEMAGIGVDTWGVDFALLSSDGSVLADPAMYRDPMTEGVMEQVFGRVSRQRIFQATGIQFMRINTLYQLIAMQQRQPELLQSAHKLLFMPDLFHRLLCSSWQSELSIASTSQMCDPVRKAWATEFLEELGIPTRILPALVKPGTVLGRLLPEVAAQCDMGGAPAVIAPASHDTASAVAAVPAEDGLAWCYISSGTWSLIGVELDEPIINDQSLSHNFTNEIGVGGRIRFLKNVMGLWLVQECRRQWQADGGGGDYADLAELAEQAPAFAAMLDPDDARFLTPGGMVEKIDDFCRRTGQAAPKSQGGYERTCLESLAMTYRRRLIALEKMIGGKIGIIHIVGGGSNNRLLNQMTADACARPVVAGPAEAAAAGNVLVQAMALGLIDSPAKARRIVRDSFALQRYEPRQTAAWDAAYQRYLQIIAEK